MCVCDGAWRRGQTSEIERSKTYVRFPVEVALANLFHFEAYNEYVPGRMCVNCQTARNARCNPSRCFLFLVGLQHRFWRAVSFVRAMISSITPVLWNSYGASIMVCPEPTFTAKI